MIIMTIMIIMIIMIIMRRQKILRIMLLVNTKMLILMLMATCTRAERKMSVNGIPTRAYTIHATFPMKKHVTIFHDVV